MYLHDVVDSIQAPPSRPATYAPSPSTTNACAVRPPACSFLSARQRVRAAVLVVHIPPPRMPFVALRCSPPLSAVKPATRPIDDPVNLARPSEAEQGREKSPDSESFVDSTSQGLSRCHILSCFDPGWAWSDARDTYYRRSETHRSVDAKYPSSANISLPSSSMESFLLFTGAGHSASQGYPLLDDE